MFACFGEIFWQKIMSLYSAERKTSLLTSKPTLVTLHTFKNFPVFIGCTDEPESKDMRADMIFDICTETGLIQLRKLLNPDLVYSGYHSEAVGGVWTRHHDELTRFILKYKPKNIIELGGSNGALAIKLTSKEPAINITMVEPNPAFLGNDKIKVIKGYFDENFKTTELFDTMIHSHVLEHLYDPIKALSQIRAFLSVGSKHIFSIPNLDRWLKQQYPNTLNFEHTLFLTEYFVDYLLAKNGFEILEKSYFEDHSIFYATQVVKKTSVPKLKNQYKKNKKLYQDFITAYRGMVKDFNAKMNSFEGPVYLFGAHIFSQSFVEFGLNVKKISGILDNSKLKQGQRLYGSSLKVMSPEIIKGKQKIAVILKAGAYTAEIKAQLKKINPSVKIWL